MGQSLTVAFKSIRAEIKRYQRKRSADVQQREEEKSILVASGCTPCVAFEEGAIPDPPFL